MEQNPREQAHAVTTRGGKTSGDEVESNKEVIVITVFTHFLLMRNQTQIGKVTYIKSHS